MSDENNYLKIEIFNSFQNNFYQDCLKNCNIRHKKNQDRNLNSFNSKEECINICEQMWKDLQNYSNRYN